MVKNYNKYFQKYKKILLIFILEKVQYSIKKIYEYYIFPAVFYLNEKFDKLKFCVIINLKL